MDLRILDDSFKDSYNKLVTHVIQSWEWGEFRKNLGLPVLRYGIFKNGKLINAFQLTLHKIPFTDKHVGYLPKGPSPDKTLAEALEEVGKLNKCAFIKIEPNIRATKPFTVYPKFIPSPKPLFTKYNFVLDLNPTEDILLSKMNSKTRYNIKVAQKHEVLVEERTDELAFDIYLKLYFGTTARQNYLGHSKDYHKKVWQTLKAAAMAKILLAFYTPPKTKTKIPLAAWMLVNFADTLYYPYGGSSVEYKEVMANNLIAWEAIKYGKKLGLSKFDMWGALGPNPDPKDPWFGFHRFKSGYGGELVEYLGTYDLIFDNVLYWMFTWVDKFTALKVFLLKLLSK